MVLLVGPRSVDSKPIQSRLAWRVQDAAVLMLRPSRSLRTATGRSAARARSTASRSGRAGMRCAPRRAAGVAAPVSRPACPTQEQTGRFCLRGQQRDHGGGLGGLEGQPVEQGGQGRWDRQSSRGLPSAAPMYVVTLVRVGGQPSPAAHQTGQPRQLLGRKWPGRLAANLETGRHCPELRRERQRKGT